METYLQSAGVIRDRWDLIWRRVERDVGFSVPVMWKGCFESARLVNPSGEVSKSGIGLLVAAVQRMAEAEIPTGDSAKVRQVQESETHRSSRESGDPRWALISRLEREARLLLADVDLPGPPFLDPARGCEEGDEPVAMHLPRVHRVHGPDAPRVVLTISFDHRVSKGSLMAWIGRAWPYLRQHGIVRPSRSSWEPRTLDLIQYMCLETTPGTSWRFHWLGWNNTRPAEWRYLNVRAFTSAFKKAEENLTGWKFGLAWFYDPLERMRLGNSDDRRAFSELVEQGDRRAKNLEVRGKERQRKIRDMQDNFERVMTDGFDMGLECCDSVVDTASRPATKPAR